MVIDCLTLWLTNLTLRLAGGPELPDEEALDALARAVRAAGSVRAQVLWLSNEVGSGVVPANPLARRLADLEGVANQALAAGCDAVHFCVAGLSLRLK